MTETEDPRTRALISLDGYVSNGARYWPCAAYFTLATMDNNGEHDGGGADVCRYCVVSVARQAAAIMRGTGDSAGGAITAAGPGAGYEITGNDDPHYLSYGGERGYCAECYSDLDGDAGREDETVPFPDTPFYARMARGHAMRKGHALTGHLEISGPDRRARIVRTCCDG